MTRLTCIITVALEKEYRKWNNVCLNTNGAFAYLAVGANRVSRIDRGGTDRQALPATEHTVRKCQVRIYFLVTRMKVLRPYREPYLCI